MERSRLRHFAPAFFPALLLTIAWSAIVLTREGGLVTAVWPVNAVLLAFLLRWPRDGAERTFVIASSAAVLLTANAIAGVAPAVALAFTTANLVEVGLVALCLRRYPDPTAGLQPLVAFLGGAVLLTPAATGALAAALLTLAGEPVTFGPTAYRWFVSHGLGMGIVGALLLTIGRHPTVAFNRAAKLRFVLAQAAVIAASVYVFLWAEQPPLFLLAPFVVVAAMSHSQFGGVTAVAIATAMALIGAKLGMGSVAVAQLIGIEAPPLTRLLLATLMFTVLPVSTLLRRLETYAEELDQRRAEAETLSEIKTRLLAHVSHEIRSPLAGVTTLAELMRNGVLGELTPSQRETLDQIVASGTQVTDLARDLTDAAVLQSGNASIELGMVPVSEALASAVIMARSRAAQYRAAIKIVPGPADTLAVVADPLRLRQILVNLIVNGAKYGGRPAKVRITTRITSTGAVRFEVSDNGSGIDSAQRERLFTEFERLGAEKLDLDGAGIGLALSRRIAQLQNGALGVEDGDLGGARFWLELPAWRPVATAA